MGKLRTVDHGEAVSACGPVRGERRSHEKRQVSVDDMTGVFARKGGRWILENESELLVLAGLGANGESVSLLRAMALALSAGVAGPDDLRKLRSCLQSLGEAEEVCWVYVPDDLVAAVTVACAHWEHEAAEQWLCWALAERLDDNLSGSLGVDAGSLCWESLHMDRFAETWHRGTGWLEELDSEFWDHLANHGNPLVRAANTASDPEAEPSQLKSLAARGELEVLDLVASHPKAQTKVLLELADRESGRPVELMWRVAQNLSAPKQVLHRLVSESLSRSAHSKDHTSHSAMEMIVAQCLLAENPNTPPRALNRLSRTGKASVLGRVALNPNTSHKTIERLATSGEWAVRRAVAYNPAASEPLLAHLASDSRREVRSAVAANRRLPSKLFCEMAHDRSFKVRESVASNPSLPSEVLQELAGDPDWRVRSEIALRDDTPPPVLAGFAADLDPRVRRITALNKSTPENALAQLADDSDSDVLRMVAVNSKTPPAALMRFAQSEDKVLRSNAAENPSMPPAAFALLAQDKYWGTQRAISENPSTPVPILELLSGSKDLYVRAWVAKNTAAPIWLVEQLAEDGCRIVFAAAADALDKRTRKSAADGDPSPTTSDRLDATALSEALRAADDQS